MTGGYSPCKYGGNNHGGTVNHRMKLARKAAGLSQEQLAEAAHISQPTVCRIELGAFASVETMMAIGAALGVDYRTIMPDPHRPADE